MSISQIQVQTKESEFRQQLLKDGIEPNNYELNKKLNEFFDHIVTGMPYYSPIKQIPYEVSSSDNYNHNFETLGEDLTTAYQANISASNKTIALQEYYDVESKNLRNLLSDLSLRITNIGDALKDSTGAIQQYVETFSDYYNIEHYGDKTRNIPYSTCCIDLFQKKVYTDKISAKIDKISLRTAKIDIKGLSAFQNYKIDGIKENILDDTFDKMFLLTASGIKQEAVMIEIVVVLNSMTTFNSLQFSFTAMRDMLCRLSLSDDGENYIPVYDLASRNFLEWNFNKKSAKYIKIACVKNEPDGMDETNDTAIYDYYFLFKNISISLESFNDKSIFVSKPISFTNLFDTIKLDVEDMIFNDTRIDYFIGFDNKTDKIGWDVVKNHSEHKLFMFEQRHKILNRSIHEFSDQGNELGLYKLYKLPDGVNESSIKLIPGYNLWSVIRYNHEQADSYENAPDLSNMDFTEYSNKCTTTQLFMDCENYQNFNIKTNVLYIFTQYVSIEESQTIENCNWQIRDTSFQSLLAADIRLFINGYEITTTTGLYSFNLKAGTSKIQIALCVKNKNALVHKLYQTMNLKKLTGDAYAYPPMTYTNDNILDKRMNINYKYYTINDGYLYVKPRPADMIISDLEDMGYLVRFTSLRQDMIEYFKEDKLSFRLMAVFNSSDSNVSPEILNYRLIGK